MRSDEERGKLIDAAVQLCAEKGIENVTTKGIMRLSGVNEAYIYRYYQSKDELLAAAFIQIASGISQVVQAAMQPILVAELDRPTRNRAMFDACWNYLCTNKTNCRFYLRFRFSSLYTQEVSKQRDEIWQPIVTAMWPYFERYGDRHMPLNHMIETAIRYASDVAEGLYENNETTAERVYQIVWAVVDMDTGPTR